MAILKSIGMRSTDLSVLDKIDKYISDPSKTQPDGVGGYGCPPDLWKDCNRAAKRYYRKIYKRQCRQIVIGFDPHDKADVKKAYKVAHEICGFFEGYYVKFAVHTNTQHIHIHLIIGNTSYITGKQLDMSKKDLSDFKKYCSDVLKRHGCGGIRMNSYNQFNGDISGSEDIDQFEIDSSKYIDNVAETLCEPMKPVVSLGSYCEEPQQVVQFITKNYNTYYLAPREYIQNQQVVTQPRYQGNYRSKNGNMGPASAPPPALPALPAAPPQIQPTASVPQLTAPYRVDVMLDAGLGCVEHRTFATADAAADFMNDCAMPFDHHFMVNGRLNPFVPQVADRTIIVPLGQS